MNLSSVQTGSTPPVVIVVAVARNRTIGYNNTLPWRLRSDLQRFKRLTMGNCLLMGRKTFESIPKPLPGRTTIVLTRDANWSMPHRDVKVARDFEQALQYVPAGQILFIVGGATIYEQYFDRASTILQTLVLADVEGDTLLPDWDRHGWELRESEYVPSGPHDQFATVFERWDRSTPNHHS